ncbi:glutamine amidotransferase [Bordetella genomosp. 12]|uniref:GMP synthase n=1 Tax=Bordetella genomosp. 12 TaxID=463035 RepID=A0A261VB67_9BORD|nr:glutamine amidotransferase [Bordetella genomosp. 12]OZI71414.1 GMP synthase [Bordetella genomosp. 12]
MLIIQAGTPPDDIRASQGDLPAWFCRALRTTTEDVEIVRVFEGERLPAPRADVPAVITGSWSHVTEQHPWSLDVAAWIREAMAMNAPMFGVCYGHQLMAAALGGEVGFHPNGREMGSRRVRLRPGAAADPLLTHCPAEFVAHLTHLQTVLRLPHGAQLLASSDHDPHQVVRYGPHAVSTQFHPEFTPSIARACIELRASTLRAEGKDPEAMLRGIEDAPVAREILERFVSVWRSTPADGK